MVLVQRWTAKCSYYQTKMNIKTYFKDCVVPCCGNTSIRTPDKLFLLVPRKPDMRKIWMQFANQNYCPSKTKLYICEDHFDLPNDMENYMQYHIMGSVKTIRLKPGCLPSKFPPQTNGKEENQRIKRNVGKTAGINTVSKKGKKNAQMRKDYYNRKKAAKEAEKIRQGLSVQKPIKKTGAERSRAFRLRKKLLLQANKSSVTEILSIPSTSNSGVRTSEPSIQSATTSASTIRPDVSTVPSTGQSHIRTKRKKKLIAECKKSLEERTVATKGGELGETPFGCSGRWYVKQKPINVCLKVSTVIE